MRPRVAIKPATGNGTSSFAKATGITASAVGASTIFSVFEENTVEETGAIGFVPVTYPNSGVAGTSWVARGIDRFTGNIFINSANGIPLAPEAYGATAIGSASSVTAAGTGDPNNNIEFQIATDVDSCPQDPAPGSNCYQGSFEIWYGEGNIVEDPKFNWARRPTYGVQPPTTQSPAIIRKAGAFPPVYDTGSRTGDWKVTRLGDFTGPRGFRKAFADSHNETLTSNLQSIHDIDGNGFVELYDFSNSKEGGFLQACINCGGDFDNNGKNDLEDILVGDLNNDNLDKNDNGILDGFEGIPATTTWTLLSMALLTAISGTVILRNKKVRTILE